MIDDTRRRAHEIFVAALDEPPARRPAMLSDACAGDAPLRAAVDRLLRAVEDSTDFLETPALGARSSRRHAPEPLPSDSIAGYRILGLLGMGGMASVYEAEQVKPRRRVALKVMHRTLLHTSGVHRFHFEAEVLARLTHPGIAQVYEVGMSRDASGRSCPFFAMEFVEGARPITDHAAMTRMPLRDRLAMFAIVCDAVQHGHQLGVIHRDLKPTNVLVDSKGNPKIIDFGVARSMLSDSDRITLFSERGQLIGTLNSMSPEQCAGGDRVDTRSDVYSLGVILYELLTGRPPYDVSDRSIPEAIGLIQSQSPARPGAIKPELRGDLEAIVMMAMDKDPQRRYQGANALAADIRRYLAYKTIQATLPSPWRRAGLFARRHKVITGAVAVTVLTVLLATTLISAFAYRAWQESLRRSEAERIAVAERDTALRQAYAASLASAFLAHGVGELTEAREQLDRAPPSLRGWEWRLLSGLVDPGEKIIQAHDDHVIDLALAPGARRVVSISRDGTAALWDLDTASPVARTAGWFDAQPEAVAITDDAETVYIGFADGTIRAWDTASDSPPVIIERHTSGVLTLSLAPGGLLASTTSDGAATLRIVGHAADAQTLDAPPGGPRGVRFSPDGARLAVWSRPGTIRVLRSDTLAPERELSLDGTISAVSWSHEGRVLAAGGAEGRVRVWDIESGEILAQIGGRPDASTVVSLAVLPGGGSVMIGSVNRSLREWRFATTGTNYGLPGHQEAVSALVFDKQGNRLVSGSWDFTVRIWPLDELTMPGAFTFLPRHDDHALSVAYSAGGDMLATAGHDDVIRLFAPTLGIELAALRGHTQVIYSARFSPDGDTLASASQDGTVRLWSTLTGECLATLEGSGGAMWTVAFSPDGGRLAAAGNDGVVTIWDLRGGESPTSFTAHPQRVIKLAFSPDGATLATCCRDGTVKLWDASTFGLRHTLVGHRSDVFSCVFTPDGARLYTGSRDQTVRVWDTRTGKEEHTLSCRGHFITSVSLNADATRLAAGSWYGEIMVWDLATHERVLSFGMYDSAIRELAFSPTDPALVLVGHGGFVLRYNAMNHAERLERRGRDLAEMELAERAAATMLASTPTGEIASAFAAIDAPTKDKGWLRVALLRAISAQNAEPR